MFNKLKNKKIYLALPYSHDDPQVREARYRTATSVAAFLMKQGATVFSPITIGHQICQYGIDTSFKRWAELDFPMISWADEFWLLQLDGHEISFGVQEELKQAMLVGTKIVRISQQDLSNFLPSSHTSASPYVATSAPRVAEVRYEFIIRSKYKYGDTIFVIVDNNKILKQEIYEIAIAFVQDKQSIAYRGLNSKIHLAVDAHGMPVRMFITAGTIADCSQACTLVKGINAENLLADKGYDSDEFVKHLEKEGINPVIPPRKNRKKLRYYDKYLYRLRHLVENAFLELKRWRGIATRYAKNTASFLAAVHIRCIAIWAKIY